MSREKHAPLWNLYVWYIHFSFHSCFTQFRYVHSSTIHHWQMAHTWMFLKPQIYLKIGINWMQPSASSVIERDSPSRYFDFFPPNNNSCFPRQDKKQSGTFGIILIWKLKKLMLSFTTGSQNFANQITFGNLIFLTFIRVLTLQNSDTKEFRQSFYFHYSPSGLSFPQSFYIPPSIHPPIPPSIAPSTPLSVPPYIPPADRLWSEDHMKFSGQKSVTKKDRDIKFFLFVQCVL
jgi:hypothetical protein